ncbi:zinc-finger of the MIZ type in Nse subunit-domain-containing protein [Aspergillus multicolor]|uniref:SUMO ligase MMS21 n=1 Tax=Aspergillus multicolor TaxID=41759 RepID=UPI003CCC9A9C
MLATPGPSRGLNNPASSSRRRDRDHDRGSPSREGTPSLPEYEAPIAPLTDPGRQALTSLLRSQNLRSLKAHIQHVEAKLTDSAGEVNERLAEAKLRAKRKAERQRESREASRAMTEGGDGEGGENVDLNDKEDPKEAERLRELEEQVEAVTGRLDEKMRRAIDSAVRVDGLSEALNKLQGEAEVTANANKQRQRQRRRRRAEVEDGDEDEDEEGDLYEASPQTEVDVTQISLRSKLERAMAEDQDKWEDMTLTERYSKHNDYIGFYRMIHEAKHPGDNVPPLPHASTWFAHLEDPNAPRRTSSARTTRQQRPRATSAASDFDDLAIESERISLKCPITLLLFRDPVSSTKCPHSFERDAISSMLEQSGLTVAAASSTSGRGGRRIRAVKCPVCEVVLTNNDLRQDPVLLRRVRRAERRQEREDEDEAELGLSGRRKIGITLGSDDDENVSRGGTASRATTVDPIRVKQERARSRGVTEVADHEEQEEEEEEEGEQASASGSDTNGSNEEESESGSNESNDDDEMEE